MERDGLPAVKYENNYTLNIEKSLRKKLESTKRPEIVCTKTAKLDAVTFELFNHACEVYYKNTSEILDFKKFHFAILALTPNILVFDIILCISLMSLLSNLLVFFPFISNVTGDGLPDFLQCELSSGSVTDCKSWINTGTGWKRDDAYALTINNCFRLVGIITPPTCPCINP
jgi:hypothetical protein